MWYMLHSIVAALLELQNAGINHGDIQPMNIMIDETGNIKVLDAMCYDPKKNNGLMRMIQGNYHTSPLAPELMPIYLKRQLAGNYNPEKADVYALGMTILCVCTVMDYRTTFYSFENYQVKMEKINAELQGMAQRHQYTSAMATGSRCARSCPVSSTRRFWMRWWARAPRASGCGRRGWSSPPLRWWRRRHGMRCMATGC